MLLMMVHLVEYSVKSVTLDAYAVQPYFVVTLMTFLAARTKGDNCTKVHKC